MVELDQRSDGSQIEMTLKRQTGLQTVPNIFINGVHLGGNAELQEASGNGTLARKLMG